MVSSMDLFERKKKFLICVDSDGSAMDTMNIKHSQCFGPCMVKEWNLGQWKLPILKRWNEINLYSATRGVNRFKGLAIALREIDQQYTSIPDVMDLVNWVDKSDTLSNSALQKIANERKSECLKKALRWSEQVNHEINEIDEKNKKPFDGVAEALAIAASVADIVVVSSANRDALEKEWYEHKLLQNVDLILAQDSGSKQSCIAALLKKGYERDHVLMVGDAPGDQEAAQSNGVCFYPILARKESESWHEFGTVALEHFRSGNYSCYEPKKIDEFWSNLSN